MACIREELRRSLTWRRLQLAASLFAILAFFAFLGAMLLGPIILASAYGYDHGDAETEKSLFAGAVIGVFVALAFHRNVTRDRKPDKPQPRSTRRS
jgi:hypothetical protein